MYLSALKISKQLLPPSLACKKYDIQYPLHTHTVPTIQTQLTAEMSVCFLCLAVTASTPQNFQVFACHPV